MSRFNSVPFNITGGTSKSRSSLNNNQRTVNFYPELDEAGKDKFILQSFPGQVHLELTNDDLTTDLNDRGLTQMSEVLYRVSGDKLLKVDSALIQTHIDDLAIDGTGRCIFANDGENLVIVTDTKKVYIYNSVSDTLVAATDSFLINDDIESVSFLNNQFIYNNNRFIAVSDVGNPDSINGLNIIGAESNPDNIILTYVYDQLIYVFGNRTIETFYNSGVGNPPIERIEGRIFQIGLASKYSVASTDNAIYFLGDDKKIYRSKGGQHEVISTTSISNQIESLTKIDDASAFTFSFEGFTFYAITFPESKKTFVMNEVYGSNGWFELNSGDFNNELYIESTYNVGSFVEVYNKRIMADLENGKLLYLDLNTYTNDGKPMLRERVCSTIDGGLLNAKGRLLQAKRIEIICEKGVGNVSGDGDDPSIILECSFDGGKTFKTISFVKIGQLGETSIKAEAFLMDKFYSMQLRFRTSDPVYYSLHSAVIDLRVAGR